jgi:hypothetical protein
MEGFSVAVEARAPADAAPLATSPSGDPQLYDLPDDDPFYRLLDDLMDAVSPHHGIVSAGPRSWGVRITVDAADARAAHEQALAIVDDARATGGLPDWPVVKTELTREDVLEAEDAGWMREFFARCGQPDAVDTLRAGSPDAQIVTFDWTSPSSTASRPVD